MANPERREPRDEFGSLVARTDGLARVQAEPGRYPSQYLQKLINQQGLTAEAAAQKYGISPEMIDWLGKRGVSFSATGVPAGGRTGHVRAAPLGGNGGGLMGGNANGDGGNAGNSVGPTGPAAGEGPGSVAMGRETLEERQARMLANDAEAAAQGFAPSPPATGLMDTAIAGQAPITATAPLAPPVAPTTPQALVASPGDPIATGGGLMDSPSLIGGYTPDVVKQHVSDSLAMGKTWTDVAQDAASRGISMEQLGSAYGYSPQQSQDFLSQQGVNWQGIWTTGPVTGAPDGGVAPTPAPFPGTTGTPAVAPTPAPTPVGPIAPPSPGVSPTPAPFPGTPAPSPAPTPGMAPPPAPGPTITPPTPPAPTGTPSTGPATLPGTPGLMDAINIPGAAQATVGTTTAAPTPTAAPVTAGTGTAGQYSATTATAAPAVTAGTATASTWTPDAKATVQGQLADITSQDNILNQMARQQGLQEGNRRGLMNSTMSAEAGQAALYRNALPIAQQDASTFAQAGQFNAQNATETSKFNTNLAFQSGVINQEQANKMNALAAEMSNRASEFNIGTKADFDKFTLDQAFKAGVINQEQLNRLSMFNSEQFNKLAMFDSQLAADVSRFNASESNALLKLGMDSQTKLSLAATEAQYRTLMQSSASAASVYQALMGQMGELLQNKDMDATAKADAIRNLTDVMNASLGVISSIANINLPELDFSDLPAPAPAPGVAPAPAGGSGFDAGTSGGSAASGQGSTDAVSSGSVGGNGIGPGDF
jgi:hypothetical protein